MELTVLSVPGCPHTPVLRERLAAALDGLDGFDGFDGLEGEVTWREVRDEDEAVRLGMHGSPTLLVDGVDVFAAPGEPASLSCRVGGPPAAEELRRVLERRASYGVAVRVADRGGAGRLAPEAGGLRAVQQAVLRAWAATGEAPDGAELDRVAAPFGRSGGEVVAELAAADYLSLDAQGRLVAAYPFSPVPTAHEVQIDGGARVSAMCAVDALGITPMLGADSVVRSADPVSGERVTVTFRDGRAEWEPEGAVVFVGSGACDGPAVETCCTRLNFFTGEDTARRWAAEHPEAPGGIVPLAEAVELGREIFGPLL